MNKTLGRKNKMDRADSLNFVFRDLTREICPTKYRNFSVVGRAVDGSESRRTNNQGETGGKGRVLVPRSDGGTEGRL